MSILEIGTANATDCFEAVKRHAHQSRQVRSWSSPAAWQEPEFPGYWYYGVIPHLNQGGPKTVLIWLDETGLF
jgi:hypothetical protein